jgi:hypothetical protein
MSSARWNIVTGLRTPEELLLLKERFPESRIVLIDADPKIRFERHIKRARDQDLKTFAAFQEEDEKQRRFGVLRVTAEITETLINNESSIDQYKGRIDAFLDDLTKARSSVTSADRERGHSELHRCLSALRRINSAASCEQIYEETARAGAPVRVYNTNRALKDVPEFASRIVRPDALLRYTMTARGRELLRLLDLLKKSRETKPFALQLPFEGELR